MVRQLLSILTISFILQSCGNPLQKSGGDTRSIQAFGISDSELKTYWDSGQLPLSIQVDPYFDQDEYEGIVSIGKKWNDAAGKSLFQFERAASSPQNSNLDDYNDQKLGIYFQDKWFEELSPHALAVTQFYGQKVWKNGEEVIRIVHADILINGEYYDFSINSLSGTYDLLSVILHELGHFLGLKHDYNASSVMLPSLSLEQQKRSLAEEDKQDILSIYPQVEVTSLSAKSFSASTPLSDQRSQEVVVGIFEISPSKESYKQRKIIPSL